MQAGDINTYLKVEVDFTLPELSVMSVVIWKCHVDDSAKGRYDMILGRDLLTELLLNLKYLIMSLEYMMGLLKSLQQP